MANRPQNQPPNKRAGKEQWRLAQKRPPRDRNVIAALRPRDEVSATALIGSLVYLGAVNSHGGHKKKVHQSPRPIRKVANATAQRELCPRQSTTEQAGTTKLDLTRRKGATPAPCPSPGSVRRARGDSNPQQLLRFLTVHCLKNQQLQRAGDPVLFDQGTGQPSRHSRFAQCCECRLRD